MSRALSEDEKITVRERVSSILEEFGERIQGENRWDRAYRATLVRALEREGQLSPEQIAKSIQHPSMLEYFATKAKTSERITHMWNSLIERLAIWEVQHEQRFDDEAVPGELMRLLDIQFPAPAEKARER